MRSNAVITHRWPAIPMMRTVPLAVVFVFVFVFANVMSTSPAWAAKPVPGATYRAGSGGGDTQVVLKVSKNGRRLTPMDVSTFSSCSNGRADWLASYYGDLLPNPARLPIASSGTFAGTFEQYPPFLDVFVASETFSLSGKFIRSGNAVRVVVRTTTVGEGGTVCDSGERTVVARRIRRRA
jgi:hypothetical protein